MKHFFIRVTWMFLKESITEAEVVEAITQFGKSYYAYITETSKEGKLHNHFLIGIDNSVVIKKSTMSNLLGKYVQRGNKAYSCKEVFPEEGDDIPIEILAYMMKTGMPIMSGISQENIDKAMGRKERIETEIAQRAEKKKAEKINKFDLFVKLLENRPNLDTHNLIQFVVEYHRDNVLPFSTGALAILCDRLRLHLIRDEATVASISSKIFRTMIPRD